VRGGVSPVFATECGSVRLVASAAPSPVHTLDGTVVRKKQQVFSLSQSFVVHAKVQPALLLIPWRHWSWPTLRWFGAPNLYPIPSHPALDRWVVLSSPPFSEATPPKAEGACCRISVS
jgi:hypothetical protein